MQHNTTLSGERLNTPKWEEMENLYNMLSPTEQKHIVRSAKVIWFKHRIKKYIIVSLALYIAIVVIYTLLV